MLVLLIIFMVATPMMQQGFDVRLPVSRRSAPMASERIFVNVPLSYRSSRIVYLGEDPIRIEILEERVRQALLTSSTKEVFLRGDGLAVEAGRSTLMSTVARGAATMKMISSTSITSMNGVTLIS